MFLMLVLEQYKLITSRKEVSSIRRQGTLRKGIESYLKQAFATHIFIGHFGTPGIRNLYEFSIARNNNSCKKCRFTLHWCFIEIQCGS